jgi:hypothetical protein
MHQTLVAAFGGGGYSCMAVGRTSHYEPTPFSSQQPASQPENITRLRVLRLVEARKMQRREIAQCDGNEKGETKGDRGKKRQEAA